MRLLNNIYIYVRDIDKAFIHGLYTNETLYDFIILFIGDRFVMLFARFIACV